MCKLIFSSCTTLNCLPKSGRNSTMHFRRQNEKKAFLFVFPVLLCITLAANSQETVHNRSNKHPIERLADLDISSDFELIWHDEFEVPGKPDPDKWSYEIGFKRNKELQWYQKENANVRNGMLELIARVEKKPNPDYDYTSKNWRENRPEANYTSASINTKNKFHFQYGILEVRAKIDTSSGMWPAIWTLGVSRKWPANGEIDLMEFYRIDSIPSILANAAWENSKDTIVWDSKKIKLDEFVESDPQWNEKFHIWKMEWTKNHIRLYLDDVLLNEIPILNNEYNGNFNPFHQKHYILLNLAIGSNGGDPSQTEFPKSYLVDYVRVYQKKEL